MVLITNFKAASQTFHFCHPKFHHDAHADTQITSSMDFDLLCCPLGFGRYIGLEVVRNENSGGGKSDVGCYPIAPSCIG